MAMMFENCKVLVCHDFTALIFSGEKITHSERENAEKQFILVPKRIFDKASRVWDALGWEFTMSLSTTYFKNNGREAILSSLMIGEDLENRISFSNALRVLENMNSTM